MNIAIWVVTIVLAAVFLLAGVMKIITPKEQLYARGMKYVEDFSANTTKAIGGLEVLAAVGLILPALFDIATILVPLAATGLVATMVGAAIVHIRRGEISGLVAPIALGVLALFVAITRFGSYPL